MFGDEGLNDFFPSIVTTLNLIPVNVIHGCYQFCQE